jgi:glycosyltransferase involved in cell wall biosynthesis
MTRVLMLSQFFPPVIGGEERHVYNLSAALRRRGEDVHVATFMTPAGAPVGAEGVETHTVRNLSSRVPSSLTEAARPYALPFPDPTTVRDLAAIIKEFRPDVVHAHNWIAASYLPLRIRGGAPIALSLHDYSHVCATKRMMNAEGVCSGPKPLKCALCCSQHYGGFRGPVLLGAVSGMRLVKRRLVDRMLPVSRAVANASQLPGSGYDWEVLPNFVPDRLTELPVAARDAALPTTPYLLYVGDLSAQKGIATLLAAHRRLPEGRPALVLIGRPTPDVPADLAADVFVHRGWVHERIVNAFHHALGAVLPSEWPDPCPTTVLEAMALGTALVTTTQGGIADMVTPGVSALVAPPGDVDGLASALATLSSDGALRQRLVQAATARLSPFLESGVTARAMGIYRHLQETAHAA